MFKIQESASEDTGIEIEPTDRLSKRGMTI